MNYTEKPDYGPVDICTRDSLRELVTPGLLAVLNPIAVGFAFGYAPLGSYLAGVTAAGVLMAVFLANSGGAWENARSWSRTATTSFPAPAGSWWSSRNWLRTPPGSSAC